MAQASNDPKTRLDRPRGFTLTELLVVILIVAVLALIGFTGARRAISSAHRATCIGQLQQVGIATSAYIADHNGSMPGPLHANGQSPNYGPSDGGNIFGFLQSYLGLERPSRLIGLPDSHCCPAFRKANPQWNANGDGRGAGRAYFMNQDQRINGKRVFGPQSVNDPVRETLRYAVMLDGTGRTPLAKLPMITDAGAVHGNVRNMLFLDFHVESVPLDHPVNGLE